MNFTELRVSAYVLILGICIQLFTMVIKKSKNVSPLAFFILALGNFLRVQDEMKKGQKAYLFTPSFFAIMNLLVAFYAM